MLFNSIKEINRLGKEINRLLSKGMSNIYLKITVEKRWRTQNFDFINSENLSPCGDIIEFSGFLLQLKNQRSGSKTVCGFSIIFILKGFIMTL